jgi:multidrug efflux system outer membrane protein
VVVRPIDQSAAVYRRQQSGPATLCGSGEKGLIATYEKSIQSAFKDVADALARRETLSEQLDAQRQYVAAEQTSLDIALKRYQTGVGDYLSVLTAQRTLWSAQATLISLQQTDLENRITLWQSLGGGAS